jgi:hypothetical protein
MSADERAAAMDAQFTAAARIVARSRAWGPWARTLLGLTIALLVLLAVAGCGSQSEPAAPANTNPRLGWVDVFDGSRADGDGSPIRKRCDGTTLLYAGGWHEVITAVPDSRECAR